MKDEIELNDQMAQHLKDSNEEDDYDANVNTKSESENEEEDLECDECSEVSENFDAYIEHMGKGDCAFWCNHCDKFYRKEEDLKKHIDKHCTNCGKQFETKNACYSHKTKCNSI